MNVKRITMLGVAGGALAAWFAAASTTGRPSIAPVAPRTATAVELRGAELAVEIARLRERLHPTTPPQAVRNLFEFSQARAGSRRGQVDAPNVSMATERQTPGFAPPPLRLVGIAEETGPDGIVRTAMISGLDQLFFAKVGERVTDRYQIAKISGEAAELLDLDSSATLTLVLR